MREVQVVAAVHQRAQGKQWFPHWHNVDIGFPEKMANFETILTLAQIGKC